MMIKRNITAIILMVGMIAVLPMRNFAQESSTYKMKFVRACQDSSDKGNYIMAVFSVLPTIKDFKLILSMRVTYALGHEKENVTVLKENEDNIKIHIYGTTVKEKNPLVYDFIKDSVQLETEEDLRLIVLYFHNVTKEKVDEMSITYGLWESDNPDVRHENKYDFKVESVESGYILNSMKQGMQGVKH
jgi:hypothetical protein